MEQEEAPQQEAPVPQAPAVNPEDLIDKLKFLQYESGFCAHYGFPALHYTTFVQASSNPNEQFYTWTCLVSWLLGLCGIRFEAPDQFSDPNATASGVLEALRRGRFPADFPPNKIKSGFGDICCVVLNNIVDKALESTGFQIQKVVHDAVDEDEAVDDDGDDGADMGDEANAAEQEDGMFVENVGAGGDKPVTLQMVQSDIDPEQWKLEAERVAPLLKVRTEADAKEWRSRMDTTRDMQQNIIAAMPDTRDKLSRIGANVSKAIELIRTREKYINSQHESLVAEYRRVRQNMEEVQRRHQDGSEQASEKSNDLKKISEELENIKAEMEGRSTGMGDSAPLVKLKDAMKKLQREMREMELRLGVVTGQVLATTVERSTKGGDVDESTNSVDDDDDLIDY